MEGISGVAEGMIFGDRGRNRLWGGGVIQTVQVACWNSLFLFTYIHTQLFMAENSLL
jgi:hypothetical protein